MSENVVCAYIECDGPIPPRIGGRGPFRKYCSDECRLAVYRGGPRPDKLVNCRECGIEFERDLGVPGKPKTICSDECVQTRAERYFCERQKGNIKELTRNIRTGTDYVFVDDKDTQDRSIEVLRKYLDKLGMQL